MFPFTSTASPPAPLAIRKAPSASVESIEPRPPRPCEVGRPKGRRRKNRRQSHTFFFSTCCAWHTNSPPRPGEAPHPAPSARKSVIRLHRKLPSVPPASITLNLGVGSRFPFTYRSPPRAPWGSFPPKHTFCLIRLA